MAGTEQARSRLPRSTLAEVLRARAEAAPDVPAIVSRDRQWTYGDLADRVRPAAAQPADLVAIDGRDPVALAVAVIVVAAHQAAVPIPDDLPDDARRQVLARLAPSEIVPAEAVVDGQWSPHGPGRDPTIDDVAFALMTSGSTGRPKLVPNTHRNLWASADGTHERHLLGPGDRMLAIGSMAHALGIRCVTDVLWCGATMVVADDLMVDTIRLVLRDLRPTAVLSTPPSLHTLAVAFEGLTPADQETLRPGLRFVRCGSAAMPPGISARLEELLQCPVLQGYGMSEAAKISQSPVDGSAPRGSVGRPVHLELKLVDDEVWVKGDAVSPGYLDDEHRSASAFVDGWFRTGDLARFDDDGYLYVLGRRDDVVSRGGELVSLAALERELGAHPDVESALAAAVPHASLGTDVVVAYVGQAGHTAAGPAELREFLKTRLPRSQVPTRLMAVDALPLTASGKPSRRALAAQLETHAAAVAASVADPDATELQLAALWRETLGVDVAIGPEDDFFALGGESLQLVELCSLVADRLRVELAPAEVIGEPTLAGMAALVRRDRRRRARRPVLIPLRSGQGDSAALYLVPGAGGTLAALHRFVFHLDRGRRILGFEAPGLYEGERPRRTVAALARCYVDELVADAGDQPFAVVGTSFGSVVAQEMTRQLEARGTPPALLVMVDGAVPRRRPRAKKPVKRFVWKVLHWRPRRHGPAGGLRPRVHRHQLASRKASGKHQPQPTSVPTVLVTSTQVRTRTGDPLLGWRPYVGDDVTALEFDGGHGDLIRMRTHEFAPELDRLLSAYDPTPSPVG